MSLIVRIRKKLAAFSLEIDLEAEAEVVGLLGESGCGKSMTMRCIAGVERPDEGLIVVNGVTYFDSAARVDLSPQQRKTALLFQNYMLLPHMTVADNIAIGIPLDTPVADRDAAVAREVERFDLAGLENRYPLQLSGGQQQRVALARMLAANPGILMLDEPFSALDSHLKDRLARDLSRMFAEYQGTILYVSHDVDEAIRFCDRIAVMERGRVAEMSSPGDLVEQPRSKAGLRLTGCKNVVDIQRTASCEVAVPAWGVRLQTGSPVPEDAKTLGVHDIHVRKASGPGSNAFRVVVEDVYDARYDRTAALKFADAAGAMDETLLWRVQKIDVPEASLPHAGDELWVQIPAEHLIMI